MRIDGKNSVVAVTAAAMLLAAGIALAKSHDHGQRGGPPGDGGGRHGSSDGGAGPRAGTGGPHRAGAACDPAAVAAVDLAVAAACPCAGVDDGAGGVTPWRNHGQYVRCVAHATRDELRSAGLKRRCLKGAVSCAARSSCGKDGAVACVVASTGTCVGGACSNAPETPCTADQDCTTSECRVTSAARCGTVGGTPTTGTCCAASPSGAFLDARAF
jgi:hypothetical protein